ncbi:IclR family transcriptional regulator, partial [Haloferax marisrubri]|uniref:IclR family transcriptional regulator n=1 Tax=Haloferax marisrubri TaxID=1544719 RepID=UPI0007339DBD
MTNADQPRIKAVDKTLTILEIVVELDGATLAEVDSRVELSKSSTYNHLQTLLRRHYLEKRGEEYLPGLNCLTLGGAARAHNKLYKEARPVVDTIADETDELAILTIESNGESIYLYRSEGKNALSTDSYVGCRFPLHCSGAGKVMLAYMDEERRDSIIENHGLAKWTRNTLTKKDELLEEL